MGIAVYEPETDRAAIDTVRRADKNMYENKREKKAAAGEK
jgi:GGDEF domain-containing protein